MNIKRLIRSYTGTILNVSTLILMIGGMSPIIARVTAPTAPIPQEPSFKISDDELKMLNLDPNEAQELKQFFDELNKLSPQQKQELEELGRATEERMKQQNLDPNNLDDLMKFMETEGLTQPQPKKPVRKAPPRRKPRPRPKPKPVDDEREIVSITSPSDTKTMLNELIKHLGSLRQKAITRAAISQKLESVQDQVNQLSFYLNLLRSPDLIKLLTSKEFVQLHGALEKLHKSFMSYEPSISARKRSDVLNPDDPYEVLDLHYNATPKEIEAKFVDLATSRSPQAIEAQLEQEGCEEKVCNRIKKVANRTFDLILQAYNTLKDPEKRAEVDESLREKIAKESRREATSLRAFNELFAAISSAFTMERLIPQMDQLLEKHKPEELAQMKAQMELEKKVYERSKKRVVVPQVTTGRKRQRMGGQYDSFYKKMSRQQPRFGRQFGRGRPMRRPMPPRARPAAKPGAQGAPGKTNGKPKKDAGKPKKDDKKKAPDKAKKDAAPKPFRKEDLDKLVDLKSVGSLFSKAKKKKGKIDVEFKFTRSPSGEIVEQDEPVKGTATLDQIMNRLEDELIRGQEPNAPMHLEQYFKEHKLEKIEKALKKAAPGKGKKLNGDEVSGSWADNVGTYADMIKSWHDKVFNILDTLERTNYKPTQIPEDKKKFYGLDIKDVDPWKKPPKDGEEEPPKPKVKGTHLGKIRSSIKAIHTYVTETKV